MPMLWTWMAAAAQAGVCPSDYTDDLMLLDMSEAQRSLNQGDVDGFIDSAQRLEVGIPCLISEVPFPAFPPLYRTVGLMKVLNLEEEEAKLWLRTALEMEPGFTWGLSELPENDTFNRARRIYEEQRDLDASPVLASGMSLNLTEGARLLVDGRPWEEAGLSPERVHLLQLVDTDGVIRSVWLLRDAALPERLLAPSSEVAAASDEEQGREKRSRADKSRRSKDDDNAYGYSASDVTVVQRQRPVGKLPLMIGGAMGVAAAGTLYTLSFGTQDEFFDARTTAEVERLHQLTNVYFLSAVGLASLGIGASTWGLMLSEEGGALQGSWRW